MSYQTDVAALNIWAVAVGGVGGHQTRISALNEISRRLGGRNHFFATFALREISDRLGGASNMIEVLDALNVIAGALGADDEAETVSEALNNILGTFDGTPLVTSVTVTGPTDGLLTVEWTESGPGIVTVQWYANGGAISGATGTTLSTAGRAGASIVARVSKAGGNALDSDPVVLANAKPSAFTSGQWGLDDNETDGELKIDVTALPSAGDQPISALYYQINAGDPVLMEGIGTGVRLISGLTNGDEVDVQIAAESAAGLGPWSDTKSETPTKPDAVPAAFTEPMWEVYAAGVSGTLSLEIKSLPASDQPLTAIYYRIGSGDPVVITGTGTGIRTIPGLTDYVTVSVQVAAESSVGLSAEWSDIKTATPTNPTNNWNDAEAWLDAEAWSD